ncbi:hypothetical protein BVX98_06360 [bacterium F11]|nr:hypothetical protein BVX98_06360 [bacterium F11]
MKKLYVIAFAVIGLLLGSAIADAQEAPMSKAEVEAIITQIDSGNYASGKERMDLAQECRDNLPYDYTNDGAIDDDDEAWMDNYCYENGIPWFRGTAGGSMYWYRDMWQWKGISCPIPVDPVIDGVVNTADLNFIAINWYSENPNLWADLTGDGDVTSSDLMQLLMNW